MMVCIFSKTETYAIFTCQNVGSILKYNEKHLTPLRSPYVIYLAFQRIEEVG